VFSLKRKVCSFIFQFSHKDKLDDYIQGIINEEYQDMIMEGYPEYEEFQDHKKIVNEFLHDNYKPRMTSSELLAQFALYGEGPFIAEQLLKS